MRKSEQELQQAQQTRQLEQKPAAKRKTKQAPKAAETIATDNSA